VFNVVVGNTNDHARNHAAFWDGSSLQLTPAYDVCPQPRSVGEVNQAMSIARDGDRRSRLQVCVNAAGVYHLTRGQAQEEVDRLVDVVRTGWHGAAEQVGMNEPDRERLMGGAVLNPSIFYRD
jgi:serine/threonine-protein kinase HipA